MANAIEQAFRYKAWANQELLDFGQRQWNALTEADQRYFARILNHTHVVDRIFIARLKGETHPYTENNTAETPTLAELRAGMHEADGWLIEYARCASAAELEREIAFVFTDGLNGRMSAHEILLHLLTHGSNHRGMASRTLELAGLERPKDTFTRYVHQAEPARRERT